jgi:hypothetical protein
VSITKTTSRGRGASASASGGASISSAYTASPPSQVSSAALGALPKSGVQTSSKTRSLRVSGSARNTR